MKLADKFISYFPKIPLRGGPSHKAELVTEILFGDVFLIIEIAEMGDWLKVENAYDSYQGWLDAKLLYGNVEPIENIPKPSYINTKPSQIDYKGKQLFIPAGSILSREQALSCECAKPFSKTADLDFVKEIAFSFIDSPYMWGGRSHWGIDCSGFVQQVFKIAGQLFPRDAYQQAEHGVKIPYEEARAGDLAFFGTEKKETHVGIVLDDYKIIHSHGHVRIDDLSSEGIINKKINQKSHSLMHIKRIL